MQKIESNPWKSAAVTFVAFLVVGSMPLIPFLTPELGTQQFVLNAVIAAVVFFCIGIFKSLIFAKPVFRAGLSTLLTGGAAASLAYLTGCILRAFFGIV